MINCNLIHEESLYKPVGLHWNEKADCILIALEFGEGIILQKRSPQDWSIKEDEKIILGKLPIRSISIHDELELVLMVTPNQALLYSWSDEKFKYTLDREEGFYNGGFAGDGKIWLTIPAYSGCEDWSFWDYKTGKFQEYELEDKGMYKRGVTLHPSKKLIGGLWNAYDCGFYFYPVEPKKKRLFYYDLGEKSCYRREREAFAPAFNRVGDKFAFTVYADVMGENNIEKLCVYDIFDQQKPLLEVNLVYYEKESVRQAFFLGEDEYIILQKNCAVDLIDYKSGKLKRVIPNVVDYISVNPLTNQFAVLSRSKFKVFSIGETTKKSFKENLAKSISVAEKYHDQYSSSLTMAGDEKVRISAVLSEIPFVTVEFGFERAAYLLKNKKVAFEKLEPETKKEVEEWFKKNHATKLLEWEGKFRNTDKVKLEDPDGKPIKIFIEINEGETMHFFTVCFENATYKINNHEAHLIYRLPESTREVVQEWIYEYYSIPKPSPPSATMKDVFIPPPKKKTTPPKRKLQPKLNYVPTKSKQALTFFQKIKKWLG